MHWRYIDEMNDQENTNVLQQNYILWKWEISLNDQDQLKYRYVSGEMKLGRKETTQLNKQIVDLLVLWV